MCGVIAADEARHARAYTDFISQIIKVDPNEVMIAFEDMMRKKIVMPAHFLRELGKKAGETFTHFADAAQRLGVYTAIDYVDILKQLTAEWDLAGLKDLNEQGEKARDYVMKLPERLIRIADRMKSPSLEAYIPDYGWLGLDPTNNCIANETHVRLAVGRNFSDCSPVKGVYKGLPQHKLEVSVSVSYEDDEDFQQELPNVVIEKTTKDISDNSYRRYEEMQQQQ